MRKGRQKQLGRQTIFEIACNNWFTKIATEKSRTFVKSITF
jgi:hypothetical protein